MLLNILNYIVGNLVFFTGAYSNNVFPEQLPEEKENLTSRKVRIETELKNQKERLIGIEEKVTKLQKRKEIAKTLKDLRRYAIGWYSSN